MTLTLHNPVNQAHIEDLKDRLSAQFALAASADPCRKVWVQSVISTLVEMVQAMDRGSASEHDVREVFAAFPVPGFRVDQWLAEMVEEGIYLTKELQHAA